MPGIQMNQNFLFSNPSTSHMIIRIAGNDALKYFVDRGLGDSEVDTAGGTL